MNRREFFNSALVGAISSTGAATTSMASLLEAQSAVCKARYEDLKKTLKRESNTLCEQIALIQTQTDQLRRKLGVQQAQLYLIFALLIFSYVTDGGMSWALFTNNLPVA